MPYGKIENVLVYYYGIQLATMVGTVADHSGKFPSYLICYSEDDGLYFGIKLNESILNDLMNDRIDFKTAFINGGIDESYIIVEPHLLPTFQRTTMGLTEYFFFKVDEFNSEFETWAIPDSELFWSQV